MLFTFLSDPSIPHFQPSCVTPPSFIRANAEKSGGKLWCGSQLSEGGFLFCAHSTPPTPPNVWSSTSGEITSRFPSLHPKYESLPDLLMNVIKYTK